MPYKATVVEVTQFVTVSNLAPGASSLLKVLTDPNLPLQERVKVDTKIRDLTIKDWALIVRAFKNWPFVPEVRLIT